MTRPRYVRGQLPVVTAGDWQWKKRTQTNPLRLNTLKSKTYTCSEENEPIEVNELNFSGLARKMGGFSGNMNGAHPLYSRFAKDRSWKLENRNWRSGNSRLGTKPECPLYSMEYGLPFPVLFPIAKGRKLESRKPKIGKPSLGRGAVEEGRPTTESRIPGPLAPST